MTSVKYLRREIKSLTDEIISDVLYLHDILHSDIYNGTKEEIRALLIEINSELNDIYPNLINDGKFSAYL